MHRQAQQPAKTKLRAGAQAFEFAPSQAASPAKPAVAAQQAVAQAAAQDSSAAADNTPAKPKTLIEILAWAPPQKQQQNDLVDSSSAQFDAIETLQFQDQDLSTLLRMRHADFWSQVVHAPSVAEFIDSYLWHAHQRLQRPDQGAPEENSRIRELEASIARRVFLCLLRMATPRESSGEGWEDEAFGRLIYDNYVFSVHTLFDLCFVFGRANAALTRQLVSTVFRCQPSYYDDLFDAISLSVKALSELAANVHGSDGSIKQTRSELHSVLAYLQDLIRSLLCFVEMLPDAAGTCEDAKLLRSLVVCYEVTVPLLQHQLELLNASAGGAAASKDDKSFQSKASGMAMLRDIRLSIVKLAHLIIRHRYLQPIASASSAADSKSKPSKPTADADSTPKDLRGATEKFSTLLTDLAKAATDASKGVGLKVVNKIRALSFVRHYNRLYKLEQLLRALVKQKNPIGEARLNHLISIVQEAMTRGTARRSKAPVGNDAKRAAAAAEPFNLASLIWQLRGVFADFSDDFARACLRENGWNVDRTMAAILDAKLPQHLQEVKDRKRYREGGASAAGPEPISLARQPSGGKPDVKSAAASLAMDFGALSLGGELRNKKLDDDLISNASENLLDDDANDDEEFQRFLNRTGRVKKDEAVRDRKSQLSKFDKDEEETEMLKDNIVSWYDQYEDEYDDAYDDFLSFKVDETDLDVNDPSSDRAGGGGGGPPGGARLFSQAPLERNPNHYHESADEKAAEPVDDITPEERKAVEMRPIKRKPAKPAVGNNESEPAPQTGKRGKGGRGGGNQKGKQQQQQQQSRTADSADSKSGAKDDPNRIRGLHEDDHDDGPSCTSGIGAPRSSQQQAQQQQQAQSQVLPSRVFSSRGGRGGGQSSGRGGGAGAGAGGQRGSAPGGPADADIEGGAGEGSAPSGSGGGGNASRGGGGGGQRGGHRGGGPPKTAAANARKNHNRKAGRGKKLAAANRGAFT